MIKAIGLTKVFESYVAVDNVSFNVAAGETLVLLGTSGSGKTTTLRLINRLLEPTAGEILINNQSIFATPPEALRRSIGYVLQNHGLFPHYTVAENIAMVPRLLKWPAAKISKRVTELLEKLQLPTAQFAHTYPDRLSGGQKQRVGLARALAASPPILLMDEPFGALDPITRTEIKNQFRQLDELKRKTIILVTHDVQEAFELGDRIALMDKGKLVQIGTPTELLFASTSMFGQSFFQQQRLALELKTLTLQKIWTDLPVATNQAKITLSADQNFWEALEILTSKADTINIQQEENTGLKELQLCHLQKFLQQLKQS